MTLQECKDQVSIDNFNVEFHVAIAMADEDDLYRIVNEVAKLYATEKAKEALKLAAERATCSDASWNAMPYYTVDTQSILDLETELIELINKEK